MVPIWIFRKRNGKECPCPFAKVRNPANPLSRFDGVPCTQRTWFWGILTTFQREKRKESSQDDRILGMYVSWWKHSDYLQTYNPIKPIFFDMWIPWKAVWSHLCENLVCSFFLKHRPSIVSYIKTPYSCMGVWWGMADVFIQLPFVFALSFTSHIIGVCKFDIW